MHVDGHVSLVALQFCLVWPPGAGWWATNNILQGCPLGIILLTTVWKMEIGMLECHMVVIIMGQLLLSVQLLVLPGQKLPRSSCSKGPDERVSIR